MYIGRVLDAETTGELLVHYYPTRAFTQNVPGYLDERTLAIGLPAPVL